MRILSIRLNNLNSLRSRVEIDFEKAPFTYSNLFAITGDTGAGKTTLLDAMTLALYGRTSRDHEKEVMSNGATEAWAEVEFKSKEQVYRVKWLQNRNKKGELQTPVREIARRQADGQFEVLGSGRQKVDSRSAGDKGLVEQACGLNYEQFRRSVLLAQGDFAAFLKATENERGALLERLTDAGIYGQLSIAAFQRYTEAKNQLATLQKDKDFYRLLDEESIQAIQAQVLQQRAESAEKQQALQALRANQHWLEEKQRLNDKAQQLQQLQLELEAAISAFDTDQNLLEQHRKAQPFQNQIIQYQNLITEKQEIERQLTQLSTEEQSARLDLEKTKSLLQQFRDQITQSEQINAATEIKLRQVLVLDEQLGFQQQQLETGQAQQQQQQSQYDNLKNAFLQKKQDKESHETRLLEINAWMEQHPHAKTLSQDLPQAENHRNRMLLLFKEQEKTEKEISQAQERLNQLGAQRPAMDLRQSQLNTTLEQLEAEKTGLLSTFELQSTQDQTTPELQLLTTIERLGADLKSLESFKIQHQQYRQTLNDLGAAREEQTHYVTEAFGIGKDLLNILDLVDELEEKLILKKQRYEREQALLQYARDREQLQDGESCPLCGSTEHPFRLHPIEPFAEDALREFEAVQLQLKNLRQKQLGLSNRQLHLQERLETVEEEFGATLSGQTKLLLERIQQQEASILRLLPAIEEMQLEAREQFIQEKINALENKLQWLHTGKHQITQLQTTLIQTQKQVDEVGQQIQQLQHQIDLAHTDHQFFIRQQQQYQAQFEEEKEALNHLLSPFGIVFEQGPAFKQQFETLRQTDREYQQRWEQQLQSRQQLELLSQSLRETGLQLETLQTQLTQQTQAMKQQQLQVQILRQQRMDLLGDADPESIRQDMTRQLDALKQALETQTQAEKNENSRLARAQAMQQSLQQQFQQMAGKSLDLEKSLQKALLKTSFTDIEALQAALLPENQANALENTEAQLRQRNTALLQSKADLDQSQQQWAQQTFLIQDMETVQNNLAQLQAAYEQVLQHIGSLETQLRINEHAQLEVQDLQALIQRQGKELQKWEKLNDLIGHHDGMKFRRFAQGLTLQNLVQHANHHLSRLQDGRYRLQKRANADLELEIVDTFQADHLRSVNTLSGGESFLTSLALALGLADLAGRKTRIESLFIDEGFGALDENALEVAIGSLESLQASGILIGVISHIKEMKERIGAQIQVLKKSDGFSEVVVAG